MYICRILLIQLLGCHIEINACLVLSTIILADVAIDDLYSALTCIYGFVCTLTFYIRYQRHRRMRSSNVSLDAYRLVLDFFYDFCMFVVGLVCVFILNSFFSIICCLISPVFFLC